LSIDVQYLAGALYPCGNGKYGKSIGKSNAEYAKYLLNAPVTLKLEIATFVCILGNTFEFPNVMKALLIEYDELAPVLDTYDVALKLAYQL
jgi:hypothetical protein